MQSDDPGPIDALSSAESWVLDKVWGLRVFPDSSERMNLSLFDYLQQQKAHGGILWVSQFTLAAELPSGFRPSFTRAMDPQIARSRFDLFCKAAQSRIRPEIPMIFGDFGQDMSLRYTNWGPLSVLLDR
jgi:D-tyrosyl-tRNA(Tyr) deacylase